MKRAYPFLPLLVLAGCVVNPMPAKDLFGTSNPTFEYKRTPRGVELKAGTNTAGTVEARYHEVTGNLVYMKADLSSDPTSVVDAEGRRIPGMEAQRIADEQRALMQEQIRSEERREHSKNLMEVVKMGLSQSPGKIRDEAPSSDPAIQSLREQVREAIRQELEARQRNETPVDKPDAPDGPLL